MDSEFSPFIFQFRQFLQSHLNLHFWHLLMSEQSLHFSHLIMPQFTLQCWHLLLSNLNLKLRHFLLSHLTLKFCHFLFSHLTIQFSHILTSICILIAKNQGTSDTFMVGGRWDDELWANSCTSAPVFKDYRCPGLVITKLPSGLAKWRSPKWCIESRWAISV
jgi:hypothetical protein